MESNNQTNKIFRFSDNVIARIAQSLQESILEGIDVVDILRQIEVVDDGTCDLQLNPAYMQRVVSYHQKIEEAASQLQAQTKIID